MLLKRMLTLAAVLSPSLCALLFLGGCGGQEFRKIDYAGNPSSPGFQVLPPKIDLVFVPDNTPSGAATYSQLQAKFNDFTNQLQNGTYNWDYHIANVPVANPSDINRVLVNPQYNSATLADGSQVPSVPNPGLVGGNYAVTDPAQFPLLTTTANASNADMTYKNLLTVLQDAQNFGTCTNLSCPNFLRQDAMLAIVVLTNGAEIEVDSNQNGTISNPALLQSYANQLMALKGNVPGMVRFYPIAANSYHFGSANDYCLVPGAGSFQGNSYFAMLTTPGTQIQGASFDFCDINSLGNAMSNIAAQLSSVSKAYVYSYIVLNNEPVASSLSISVNGSAIPQGASNGWQYLGFSTVDTITGVCKLDSTGKCPRGSDGSFLPGAVTALNPGLNRRTGYVIKLNGSAQVAGSDTIQIDNYQLH